MKHLKSFESSNDNIDYNFYYSNNKNYYFKMNDIVMCINNSSAELNLKKYAIYKVENWTDLTDQYEIKIGDRWYNAKRFVLATQENIDKYELEQNINKYNL